METLLQLNPFSNFYHAWKNNFELELGGMGRIPLNLNGLNSRYKGAYFIFYGILECYPIHPGIYDFSIIKYKLQIGHLNPDLQKYIYFMIIGKSG